MKTAFVLGESLVREWTEKAPLQIEAPTIVKLYQWGENCTKWWNIWAVEVLSFLSICNYGQCRGVMFTCLFRSYFSFQGTFSTGERTAEIPLHLDSTQINQLWCISRNKSLILPFLGGTRSQIQKEIRRFRKRRGNVPIDKNVDTYWAVKSPP